jgi:hypothetical protein
MINKNAFLLSNECLKNSFGKSSSNFLKLSLLSINGMVVEEYSNGGKIEYIFMKNSCHNCQTAYYIFYC